MAKVLISESTLKDMADSIREKTGSTEKLKPSDMVTDINSLYIGSDTRDANATAKDLLLNKTAYANEVKLTGTHNIEKDLNTNIFKTFTVNLDQSNLANYYLEELSSGTLLTANLYGFIGHLKELNNNLLPKDFVMVSPNTAPYLISMQIGNDNYLYFDTNYTLGFTQFDSMAGTGFVSAFLAQTGMTQTQLNSLSGWFNANTLQPVVNPIVINDLLIEEAFTSTVGDFIQNGQNFHYTSTRINIDDSLYNISYTKHDGTTEAQDIKDTFSAIVNNSYLNNATATAEDIAQGKIAFIQGGKVTGTASGGGDYNVVMDGLLNPTSSVGQHTLKGLITEIKSPFDVSNKTGLGSLFEYCRSLKTSPELIVSPNLTSIAYSFSYCEKLENVTLFDTSTITSFEKTFEYCYKLEVAPAFNTRSGKYFSSCFLNCSVLKDVPIYNMVSVANTNYLGNMFLNCPQLTNNSLNNILATLLTIPSTATGTKTLKSIGFSSTQATTCTTLSNWAACEAAGWTTGY